MAGCKKFPEFKDCKDPNSEIPYSFNWKPWTDNEGTTLVDNPANVTIVTAVNEAFDVADDTNPLVTGITTIDVVNSVVYVWFTGGTSGLKYNITCRITAANNMIEDQTAVLSCAEK